MLNGNPASASLFRTSLRAWQAKYKALRAAGSESNPETGGVTRLRRTPGVRRSSHNTNRAAPILASEGR